MQRYKNFEINARKIADCCGVNSALLKLIPEFLVKRSSGIRCNFAASINQKENIQVFDFQLTDAEMQAIRRLNKELRFFKAPYEEVQKFVMMELQDVEKKKW